MYIYGYQMNCSPIEEGIILKRIKSSQICEVFNKKAWSFQLFIVFLHRYISLSGMKILFPERIEEFSRRHADVKEALERWSSILADAQWKSHADLKADFPSADFVGNNRYVFNIKGNNYRTVVLVVFFAGTVAIRFIGTHGEYDKIKDIKNI